MSSLWPGAVKRTFQLSFNINPEGKMKRTILRNGKQVDISDFIGGGERYKRRNIFRDMPAEGFFFVESNEKKEKEKRTE